MKLLGQGSQGLVYLCKALKGPRVLFTLKCLQPHLVNDESAIMSIQKEARTLYLLNNRNVVKPYSIFSVGGRVAFAMEYADGGDLAEVLESGRALSFSEIVHLLLEVCNGVKAIHQLGLMHGDLKPENILLTATGRVKLADLGMVMDVPMSSMRDYENLGGSPDYLAPEYITQESIGFFSDIYSIGVIAFELICGRLPFESENVVDLLEAKVMRDPENISQIRNDCPEGLMALTQRAISRNLKDRYQTIDPLMQDLKRVARTLPKKGNRIASLPFPFLPPLRNRIVSLQKTKIRQFFSTWMSRFFSFL